MRDTDETLLLNESLAWACSFGAAVKWGRGLEPALAALAGLARAKGAGLMQWDGTALRQRGNYGVANPVPLPVAGMVVGEISLPQGASGPCAILPLAHHGAAWDLLLVQFASPISADRLARLRIIAPHAAALWAICKPDAVTRGIKSANRSANPMAPALVVPILADDNPYGLSRSEMRVCELLGQGLRAHAASAALQVSVATVRTHLRNIYAKTGLAGMIEVMHHLQTYPAPRFGDGDAL